MKKLLLSEYQSAADGINITVVDNGYIVDTDTVHIYFKLNEVVAAISAEVGEEVVEVKEPKTKNAAGSRLTVTKAENGYVLSTPHFTRVYKNYNRMIDHLCPALSENFDIMPSMRVASGDSLSIKEIDRLMRECP